MNFQYVNKLVFLCGDAPCHGSEYHNGCGDSNGLSSNLCESKSVIQNLRQKGVDMTFLKINDSTNKMIAKFNDDAGEEDWITNVQLQCDGMDAITESVTKTVGDSASRSFSESSNKMIAKFNDDAGEEDWITSVQLQCDGYKDFDTMSDDAKKTLMDAITESVTKTVGDSASRSFSESLERVGGAKKTHHAVERLSEIAESPEDDDSIDEVTNKKVLLRSGSNGASDEDSDNEGRETKTKTKTPEERLVKLKSLFDAGMLTESVYLTKQKEIMKEL